MNSLQSITDTSQHDADRASSEIARSSWLKLLAVAALSIASAAAADPAKGTLTGTGKIPASVNVKHAYLIKGPNAFGDKVVRLLILSEADQVAHIKSCATMSCATSKLESGMTVEFDAGPRLLYWFVANGQRVQASGTAEPDTITLTANTPQRLTGTWTHDASAQGGPKIAVEFDAALLKEFTKGR